MILMKLLLYRRIIIPAIIPIFLIFSIITPSPAQNKADEEIRATNIMWKRVGDIITINYDLAAPPNVTYQVSVLMKKESDSSFAFTPVSLEGDIGEGLFSGTSREIRWNFQKDYDQEIDSKDIYFEVHIKSLETKIAWLYYAIGAAVAAGGLVALLVSGGGNGGGTTTIIELPMPPARP